MEANLNIHPHLKAASERNTLIAKAIKFAIDAHDSIKQVRKYTGEPYWVHVIEVADIVARYGGTDEEIIAALLHDVIEDVFPKNPKYDIWLIRQYFGVLVAELVTDLSDVFTSEAFPFYNRKKRKNLECLRMGGLLLGTKRIKLADFNSNTRSIVFHDPGFAKTYLREKEAALPALRVGDEALYQVVLQQLTESKSTLGLV